MTHVHKAGQYLREQMSPWAIALLALITAVAFTIPFLLSSPAGAIDGPAGEPTTTHGVQPEFKDGNPTVCTFSDAPEGFRINDPSSGTFTDPSNPDFSITLTIPSANPPDPRLHEGPTFDFVANGGVVEDMLVKGGPDANAYDFGAGVVSDTYLHSPVNPNNDNYYGLSHIDVCYNPTVTKSGTKFHDHDADGIRDTGDEGLSGWEIRAYADDNPANGTLDAAEFSAGPAGTDTTDADGNYSIELSVGAYIVCEVAQTDWIQSFPGNTVCSAGAPTLAPGGYAVNLIADDSGNDFGNFQQGTKSGTKVEDDNADGDITADAANFLAGWTIEVWTDGDGDGAVESGDTLAGSDTTDTNGDYTVTGLDPGNYVACEVLQTDWFQSYPTSGGDCTFLGTGYGAVGHAFNITSGEDEIDNDFGNFQNATVSGTKFKDVDGDGSGFETGDIGVQGWEIRVYVDTDDSDDLSDGDTLAGSGTTDVNGDYSISGLAPGEYIVCEVAMANWDQADPDNVICDQTSLTDTDLLTPDLSDGGYAETLASGETFDADFVNTPLSDVDVRFFDLTGSTDGSIQCVETGTTTSVETSDTTNEAGTPETVVENDGLPPGSYTCTIVITDP